MTTVFPYGEGDLNKRPITTSVKRVSSDIDLSFTATPRGGLYKKTSAAAVKQSIRKLLLTNRGDVPFQPLLGANLNNILFELSTMISEDDIRSLVTETIRRYEPRVGDIKVFADLQEDANTVTIYIVFQIIENLQVEEMQVTISRVR